MAHALARFSGERISIAPPDQASPGTSILADFPIEALRLPAMVLLTLRQLGFDRIGSLTTVARAPLVRRFGAVLALRLDQADGRVFEPIAPVLPPMSIQSRLGFAEPLLTADAFATVTGHLVRDICAILEQSGQGARRLDLLFERVDGTIQGVRIGTARPVRDARHLGRMLQERLEQVDPGLGVEAMRLIVAVADPLGSVQAASLPFKVSSAEPPAADIASLVDLLANRLGPGRIYRMAPVQSHVPERSVNRVVALTTAKDWGQGNWPANLARPNLARPVRLLDPPQPVRAMTLLPDGPPVAFTWRQVRHGVRHADGPERIMGEWWKRKREQRALRDYFRVEDEDGRRFWLFRRGNGKDPDTGDMSWFLHGFF